MCFSAIEDAMLVEKTVPTVTDEYMEESLVFENAFSVELLGIVNGTSGVCSFPVAVVIGIVVNDVSKIGVVEAEII